MKTSATKEQPRSAADVISGLRTSLTRAAPGRPRSPVAPSSRGLPSPATVRTRITPAPTTTQSLASAPRNAEMLAAAARARLFRLIADNAVPNNPELLATVDRMLSLLVRDGGPLPQVSASVAGGVEVQWLVNGELVAVIVDATGNGILWAEDNDGVELFENEGAAGSAPPVSLMRAPQA